MFARCRRMPNRRFEGLGGQTDSCESPESFDSISSKDPGVTIDELGPVWDDSISVKECSDDWAMFGLCSPSSKARPRLPELPLKDIFPRLDMKEA